MAVNKRINSIISFFICFSIFFTTFTPLKAFIKGGEALTLIIPIIIIFFYDRLYLRRQIVGVSIVVLILVLLHFARVEYFEKIIPDCLVLLFGVFALEHYFITKDEKYVKRVLITEYVIIFFLIIASIPQFLLLPNLTRMLKHAADNPSIETEYYWSISYNAVHNLPVLSVPLFALLDVVKKWRFKVTVLLCIFIILVVMILASSTTSLILLVVTYLFFMIYNRRKSVSQNIVRLSIAFLIISPFLSKSVTVAFIETVVQPMFAGSNTSKKIDEIKYYILTGDTSGDMGAREDIYQSTIDTIIDNPLFPEFDNSKIGHHSHMLDYCAAMGLIAFIPYTIFLYSRYRRPQKYLTHSRFYHTFSFLSFLVLAFFKNYFVFTSALFIVPLSLIYIENKYYK